VKKKFFQKLCTVHLNKAQIIVALDIHRRIHGKDDVQNATSRIHPSAWPQVNLETWAQLKVKLFCLAFKRRHWTADRQHRHGIAYTAANCYLCDQEPETSKHLFIFCSFTKQLWLIIL